MEKHGDKTKSGANNDTKTRPGLNNGSRLSVTVTGITIEGFGTAEENGVTIHIPDTAPGDKVSIRIEHVSRQAANAWARISAPPERGDKWKRHFCSESEQAGGRCGGCPLGHVAKDVYRDTKLAFIAKAFSEFGIETIPSNIVCENMRRYRNKSNFVVQKQKNGTIRLGSWAPRSHRFAGMDNCPINTRTISKVQRDLQLLLAENNVPVHPAPGGLRYVTVKSFESGAVLVDLVINSDTVTEFADATRAIAKHPLIHGVSITCNTEKGNQMRTTASADTTGRDTLCEQIGDTQLWMKATTFFQLNNDVSHMMYKLAAQWCDGASTIWDLYCGIGGLGLTAAITTKSALHGCDSVPAAISLARRNAEANSINALFDTIDLSKSFPCDWPGADVILINPPRRGIDAVTLNRLCEIHPGKLIYMSCHPASFARDARELCDNGYSLDETAAFDMLPNTSHVELLGRFTFGQQNT